MAITLANQSASVLGTAANTWTYTLGFTPTIGNKLALYVLTPVSAGANAGGTIVDHNDNIAACVGTRGGVTGSYNTSLYLVNVTSTSTTINLNFTAIALHAIIAAEFTGWTNISPLATLTTQTTFTSGSAFSNVPVVNGRDFVTTGTNQTGMRALGFVVNGSANVSLSSFTESTMSGTPSATITNAPANLTWFFPAVSNVSGTSASLPWSTRNWTGGPSGGNQIAFASTTGSSLTAMTVTSGPSWTQLTNPAGISTSILRCYYKSGTNLGNLGNLINSSSSSAVTALGQIFGEKSLIVNNVSSTDTYRPAGYLTSKVAYGDSQGLTDANAGYSFFWTTANTFLVAGNYAGFTNGSQTIWLTIQSVTFVPAYNTYYVTLNSSIPSIGGASTYASFSLANSIVSSNTITNGNPTDTIGLGETTTGVKQAIVSKSETMQFNSLLTGGEAPIEIIAPNSAIIKDYKVAFDQFDTATGAPDGAAVMGDSTIYIYSVPTPNWNEGDNVLFWNSQTGEFNGPLVVKTFAGPLPYTGGTSNVYAFDFYGDITQGQIGCVEYDSVILLNSTATIQDFFSMIPAQPYVNTYVDPATGDSLPFQGGFF